MVDDPNVPPPAIENDAVAQPTASAPPVSSRLNANAEDDERDALTLADYAAAGVDPPDWINDPTPDFETWRLWQANQTKALAFKRANAAKKV